ncbi:hypothetical protein BG011_009527 [Mortierella polycephala]|uniref:Chloride channel protein n=1 Tax=Mortierella polycephala TaxID=41804 RepID=A0A9P6U7U2_9FUNG|nr:hypothetical protein BG011_009527 [Mortierella polycephala]
MSQPHQHSTVHSSSEQDSLSPSNSSHRKPDHNAQDKVSGLHSSTSSSPPQTHPITSPPNQPRLSLSTQLPPDYHDWVNDVSTNKPSVPVTSSLAASTASSLRPPSSGSRFLDAVTGRSKAAQGRARRENQPSFTGSAFTNSDNETAREPEGEDENSNLAGNNDNEDNDDQLHQNQHHKVSNSSASVDDSGMQSRQDRSRSRIDREPSEDDAIHGAGSSQTPRLPPLSKSQVNVPDPSRPAFKLGAPIIPKPRPTKNRIPPTLDNATKSVDEPDQPTETSSLLGSSYRSRNPHGPINDRWNNKGSRARTPRYDGQNPQETDLDNLSDDSEDVDRNDSIRRPYRARSLSPTMEAGRGNNRDRGRVMFRNYTNANDTNGRRGNKRTFHNLRRSSMANINLVKEKFLSRRSAFYDDAKEALVKENNGIRVWYHNYTTIDWIHDFVKERVRLRHLRSLGGIRGSLMNRADSLKGWILVILTGVITACLAAFIDVSSWWLGDLRMGYCTTNFWWSQYFCCWGVTNTDECAEWVSWSQALSDDSAILGLSRDTFDWIIYCCFGLLFASICVVMVTSDETVSQQRSHGATKRRNGAGHGGIPRSSSRTSMESILVASQPKKIAYFGAGSGIPEVKTILGGFVIRGFLGFRTLMIKLIGLPLMVASGLNMGKQGPLVHIACCVANIVCRIFDKYNRNDGKRREILSAAAASGVAVAFGAPIGGVLFSLEEVSYYFPSKTMWRSYFCALISAVILKMINPYRVGKTVLFQVTYNRDWHLFEAVPFFLISVFGGVYGALFSQFHMTYSRFRSRTWIGRHPVQEVLAVTLLTCAIQWLNPWTRVNLLQLLTNLYSECTPENNLNGMCAGEINQIYPIFQLLAQVFVVKVFLNFITFGVKVPGGIFIPTMVAGAVFGRMVGLGVQWIIATNPEHQIFQGCEGDSMDCIIPGLYAMIGAAACLSGVTRMTVSLVVIMFELTGAMTYSLPIMMAVMISKFVGDAFSPDAFFNKLIDLNEHPYLDNKKDYNTFGTAADIADRFLETIDVNEMNDVHSLRRKVEILAYSGYMDGGLPIVDQGILVGYIASNELGHALDLAEQKHPECICIFRNRASSNVPATEIITSLNDIETQVSGDFDSRTGRRYAYEQPASPTRDDTDYDNDMEGHDRPIRSQHPDDESQHGNRKGRRSQFIHADSTDGSRRYGHKFGRISSTGTTDLLRDPTHTMDFTPFTDQAPLSVSLFSSMDLVMEIFIKLGIKYICVVKAGEHYGMIHKKRLLSFLKENDERKRREAQTRCF